MKKIKWLSSSVNKIKKMQEGSYLYAQKYIQTPWLATPITSYLAEKIAEKILPHTNINQYLLELEPNTGEITKAMIKQGFPANKIIAIETNKKCVHFIQKTLRGVKIIHKKKIEEGLKNLKEINNKIGCVISNAPILFKNIEERSEILTLSFQLMSENQSFFHITNSPLSSIPKNNPSKIQRKYMGTYLSRIPLTMWEYYISKERKE